MRATCDKIALDSILFLRSIRKTNSSKGSAKFLVGVHCALKSNGVLGISLVDFSGFVCKVSTRQKLKCEKVLG